MPESKADLILHPIRMRIIQSLVTGERMTTQQLGEMMPDVPQATLYRHLNKLRQAKLIEVVEKHPLRGTVEKVYALAPNGADANDGDPATLSAEDHMQLFMKFVASLIRDFGDYLQQDGYDVVRDGVTFRQVHLYLTDEEYLELLQSIRESITRYMGRKPGSGRRRRSLSTFVIPGKATEANSNHTEADHDEPHFR